MAKRNRGSGEELPKKKITRESLKELLYLYSYLKPYQGKFALSLVLLFLSSLTTLVFPFVIGQLVDASVPTAPGGAQNLLAELFGDQINLDNINNVALVLLVALLLQTVFSFFRVVWFTEVGEKALADLRKALYARLVELPMAFYARQRVGDLQSRISADVAQIKDAFSFMLAEFLRSFINLSVGLAVIFVLSARLSLYMLAIVPVIAIAAMFFGRFIRKLSRKAQDKLAESGVVVEETLQGIQNVKAFTNEKFEVARYFKSISELVNVSVKGAKYRGGFVSFIIFALFGAIIFILWLGAGMVQQGVITVGELTAFLIYTTFVGSAFGSFGDYYAQIQKTIGATERVHELIKEAPEDYARAGKEIEVKGAVEFRDVSFAYPVAEEKDAPVPVLKDISFSAEAGQTVALVGPSGAGKSTLVSLLLRFYQPDKGEIRIDGAPVQEMQLTSYRSQTAFVPQDVFLFGGTIRENIAYGNLDANEAQIIEAAKQANAHDFIEQFPGGYDTVVGERGIRLSGGQKQRVAIARAILRNPSILILDEATSALDSESEWQVQEALDKLMAGRTSFVIAHRLSTIRAADQILVLSEGKIMETGTHDELIANDEGLYSVLARMQFKTDGLPA